MRYNQLLEIQPFLITPNTIHFDQHLISINLYQHTKNQAFSSVSSRGTVDLKILQFDWPRRAFWPASPEPAFSQVWDLCKNTAVNVNFLYRPNLEKYQWLNLPINLKNPFFSPFSPFVGQKKCFPKIRLCHTQHHMGL